MEHEPYDTYTVVLNHEEQYSIWPVALTLPPGWTEIGIRSTKAECLAHIEKVWTDMRPLSLRRAMEEEPNGSTVVTASVPAKEDETLPELLCRKEQPFEVCLRPDHSLTVLKDRISRGMIKIRFADTKGGTEIGLTLDSREVSYVDANFESGTGEIHFSSKVQIDFISLLVKARLSLSTLRGSATLVPIG